MKNKLIFGGLVVLATIVILNQAKKSPDGVLAKVANLGA
jgi:hypothetical protein